MKNVENVPKQSIMRNPSTPGGKLFISNVFVVRFVKLDSIPKLWPKPITMFFAIIVMPKPKDPKGTDSREERRLLLPLLNNSFTF